MPLCLIVIAAVISIGFSTNSFAAQPTDYTRDIKPLLARKCLECHGPLKQRSGLRLDTAKLMRKGGARGPAIVPGQSGQSLLVKAITGQGKLRMPPKGKPLEDKEIQAIKRWIDEGAEAPEEMAVASWREHWSYRAPMRPAVPKVKNQGWVSNPIDAFVAAQHESRGLKPNGPAPPALLLRRVYLDLIGLPPTRQELHAFLTEFDAKPQAAYLKVVDRLLKSPRYGERWGRHWMDVWRYSDWYGRRRQNEIRYSQYHIWRWRDWIIESVNADKGYDRMIVEMLAGDEVAPGDPDVLRATAFIGRNWYKFDRDVWLRETVEHTAMGFLGLTMKCARCHDHKFDPIKQSEYYRFRAFFEPHDVRLDQVSAEADLKKDGLPRVYDAKPNAQTYLFIRGDDRNPDKKNPLKSGVPNSLGNKALDIKPVSLPVEAWYPALRPTVIDSMINNAEAKVDNFKPDKKDARLNVNKLQSYEAELVSLKARIAAERAKYASPPNPQAKQLAKVAAQAERLANLKKAELTLALAGPKKRAAAQKALKKAQDAVKQDNANYTPLGRTYPKTSTGRRLALAKWIANGKNPRTTRVAINHIWRRHFGTALVPTMANFGLSGKEPSHPNLLDWLAVEFIENGWSMKHIHRLIVTSNTYRMSSASNEHAGNLKIDPNNLFLWKANWKRMEAEVVRDSLLHAAGQLDVTMGGPELPQNLGQTSRRRSVYFRHTQDDKMEFLELFDLANPNECYERKDSVVPQQSLALMNSALALSQSRMLARKLDKELASSAEKTADADFVIGAFEQVLGRSPTVVERKRCETFLVQQQKLLKNGKSLTKFPGSAQAKVTPSANPLMRARENLVHVLFNHNDFVTIR